MKRKIIKQANQAYTLTLPIEWVRRNKLGAGSEIEVVSNEKSLIISTTNSIESKKVNLQVSDWEERSVHNVITALYAQGVDEITITSNYDISAELTRVLANVLGYALVSQEGKTYTIKDLNAGTYQHLDDIFKRVFQMVILFYESAIRDIFGSQKENLESLKRRDVEVNKFCLYLERAINKSSYQDVIKSRVIFTYSYALEKIGDEIERLWRTNIKNKPSKPKEMKEVALLSNEGLGKAFEVFYQHSIKRMEELYKIRESVREKSMSLKINNPHAMRILRHIIKIVEDAADLNHLTIIMKN